MKPTQLIGGVAFEESERKLAPLNILLVDDDDHLRSFLEEWLKDYGHSVSASPDGMAALSILEAETPDIAVLDFAMPGMNGAVLADQIAARLPSLPLVFVSGYADTAAIKIAAGEHAVILQKPFQIDQLISALNLASARSKKGASCS